MEVLDVALSEIESLQIRSRGFFRGGFDVIGEEKLTTVSHSRLTDHASFDLGKQTYACRPGRLVGWHFFLRNGDEDLARAKRNWNLRRFQISSAERSLILESGSLGWTPLWVLENGKRIGKLDRQSARGGRAHAELSKSLPDPLKVFVIYMGMVAWRRIAAVVRSVVPG